MGRRPIQESSFAIFVPYLYQKFKKIWGDFFKPSIADTQCERTCAVSMAPKCKQNKELCFVLNDAVGPVTWVRATCSRDARNKRENYTINFYSGSSDDNPPTPVSLFGTTRLHLAISDHQLDESGLDLLTYAHKRITEAIERRMSCKINISFIHSSFVDSIINLSSFELMSTFPTHFRQPQLLPPFVKMELSSCYPPRLHCRSMNQSSRLYRLMVWWWTAARGATEQLILMVCQYLYHLEMNSHPETWCYSPEGPCAEETEDDAGRFLEHRIHKTYVIVAPLFHNRIVLRIIFPRHLTIPIPQRCLPPLPPFYQLLPPIMLRQTMIVQAEEEMEGTRALYTSIFHAPLPTLLLLWHAQTRVVSERNSFWTQ